MAAVFLKLLNLSISASWLVLAVLVLRLVSKRSPKWMNVLLWGIVALRLMLPFSIESALSLIPSAETVNPAVVQFDPAPTITSGVKIIDNAVNPSLSEHFAAAPLASVNPLYVWTEIAGWVWLIGLGAMLLYAFVSYLRLRRRVSVSLPIQDNIYLCDAISSPFILGVVKPRIYLPSGLDEVQRQNVLSHERAHLARRDHWWKPLGFALLAVYWFNPVLWLAYALLCRDIELACDERVIRTMDESAVKTYSTVLLACSMPRKAVITCPLAFGEVGVKERVRNALRYKKPAFWVVAASVAVCVVVAVCFLTDPPRALSKVCGDFWDTEAVCTYTEEQPDEDARYTTANGTVRLSEHLALVRIGAARPEKKTAVNPKWSSLYLALPGADGAPAERLTIDFIREYDAPGGTKAAYTLNIGTRDDSKSYKVLSGQDEIEAFLAYLRGDTASTTGYAAYDALLAEISDLRRSGASDVQTEFSHDLLSVNDYYQTPGWLLRDLDGDGILELLLGADWGDGHTVILNIYRLDGAKAVRVVDGWSRSRYFLCSDGTLAHEWSGGADHWGRTYLRYGETLLPIESVFDRGGVWYHAKGLDALSLDDTQLEDRCKTIPRAEAEQLMERYTKQYEALPFTPFAA